ncbi:MAG: histone deacetylase [Candidatus Schekmanbacteria bacterium GWA2_38_11]|uniref:Histone deacetylase n=1 Tax=Candidatus Schekmanbacteria bacterium GWA2_38_11 TaxID=1817876 RepID=A0A1F7RQ51_9BACT|nr:MAG: histone deacetylase [Candidatus Schekmanbacteria bacterium GWA2_38_11]
MNKTGFIYHEDYLKHDTGPGHPERPERLKAIVRVLEESSLLSKLTRIEPAKSELEWIREIHTQDYIDHVSDSCKRGDIFLDSGDTGICPDSYGVAMLAAGGCLKAADAVMAGVVDNAFCAVRPPGHHAEKEEAMGFCIFNNIAILARYLQKRYGLGKILVIDWDIHHGNGTQNTFYADSSVFYFSIHQFPHYPGTGRESEKGSGDGTGFTLNVPVGIGAGDEDYIRVFNEILKPASLGYNPDFILISAGFDAHSSDPLSGTLLTEKGFETMTKIAKDIAAQCCKGRLISVLEGGYDINALARSVNVHISALME